MKHTIAFVAFSFLLLSCRREDAVSPRKREVPVKADRSHDEPAQSLKEMSSQPNPLDSDRPTNGLPSLTEIGSGSLNTRAMESVFRSVIGTDIESTIRAKEGTFFIEDPAVKVPGFRRRLCVDFTTTPDRARRLIDEMETFWKKKTFGMSDYQIEEVVFHTDAPGPLNLLFTRGARSYRVYRRYATYHEIDYRVCIDPGTGNVNITTFLGPDPKPMEREASE